MQVHHLNCATLRPRPAHLVHGIGGWWRRGRLVSHCLLIESNAGLVLVDSGLGTRDVQEPHARLGRAYTTLLAPKLDLEETAVAQVRALGFTPADVQHIVITHGDPEQIGGLDDFPRAEVHLAANEYQALHKPTKAERRRYRSCQWNAQTRFQLHAEGGERFEGFEGVRAVAGTDRILLIPLAGHTRGHCGVAVHSRGGWLLHAGGAYFHRAQLDPFQPYIPLGLSILQRYYDKDRVSRVRNQERLRRLRAERGTEISIFCAHDPMDFDMYTKTAAARAATTYQVEDGGRKRSVH